jgi:hypothetical protein
MCCELLVRGARGRIRTDDLPITSRTETFQLDPSRTIRAAQVRDRFHLMPSCGAWYQRLGCQRGCHPSSAGSSLLALTTALSIRSQSDARSPVRLKGAKAGRLAEHQVAPGSA